MFNLFMGHWFLWEISIAAMFFSTIAGVSSQSPSLNMVNPTGCPTSGCAAGQHIDFQTSFDLGTVNLSPDPNVQICVYAHTNLAATDLNFDPTGMVYGSEYTPASDACGTAPTGYSLLGGVQTHLDNGSLGDSLHFGLRIGASATTNGTIVVWVYERNDSWNRTQQVFTTLPVSPRNPIAYVANDAASCSVYSPCYINSGVDHADGLGTGLKDAIDAVEPGSTIHILGDYLIKSNPLLLNKPLAVEGINNASISYIGTDCTQPMLQITAGVTLKKINLNDGSCNLTERDLIVINSPTDVLIESNHLTDSGNAIRILPNAGKITIQFNQISDNEGYAVIRDSGGTGTFDLIANNIENNRSGFEVGCNNLGKVDHNYWGAGIEPGTAASNCTYTPGKRLGAPVAPNPGAPGLSGQIITVTDTKQYYFSNKFALQRNASSQDFNVFVVNHGHGLTENIPFGITAPESLTPCSDFWDLFLEEDAPTNATLDFFVGILSVVLV